MPRKSISDIYIGLMSGTSLDGVDIVIADFAGPIPQILFSATVAFEDPLRNRIRKMTQTRSVDLDSLCQLDTELGTLYAQIVNQAIQSIALEPRDVLAIGCHGQTIRHAPNEKFPYTLQIGDANIITAKTGISSVADFRRMDIAMGGQGAPLAPAFHNYMLRSKSLDRVILNIGGIANITYLPASTDEKVLGYDTGPGNTLMDYWINLNLGRRYDDRGRWSSSGRSIDDFLEKMLQDPYFGLTPPKSTGTEYFSPDWLDQYLTEGHAAADVQATLVSLTAKTIAHGISQLPSKPAECFVCGGGVKNFHLLSLLAEALPACRISSTADLGLDPDYVEAMAFAWLARQNIRRQCGNLSEVTRASSEVILGAFYANSSLSGCKTGI